VVKTVEVVKKIVEVGEPATGDTWEVLVGDAIDSVELVRWPVGKLQLVEDPLGDGLEEGLTVVLAPGWIITLEVTCVVVVTSEPVEDKTPEIETLELSEAEEPDKNALVVKAMVDDSVEARSDELDIPVEV
jgi:hypothetical protein